MLIFCNKNEVLFFCQLHKFNLLALCCLYALFNTSVRLSERRLQKHSVSLIFIIFFTLFTSKNLLFGNALMVEVARSIILARFGYKADFCYRFAVMYTILQSYFPATNI